MPLTPPPPISVPDPAGDYARAQSWSLVTAAKADAGNYMAWGASMLQGYLEDIRTALDEADATGDLTAVTTALNAITLYTPPGGGFTYTAPTAPTYNTVPAYNAQTLGTILDIPTVDAITIGDAPSTTMTFANGEFTDSLLTALKGRLAADIATASTGLGNAEAALFARETARQNAARAQAYTEITTYFSSRGYRRPPGALEAKIKEANDTTTIRLSDSSSQIMAESARLAVDYNKHVLSASTQLLEMLSRVFDSKTMRDFEAEKTRVTLALEGFKQVVSVALARAELNKSEIEATVAANDGTVKVFQAKIAGQIEPIKAIADTNRAMADAYGSAVAGATANLNAQVIPEELKIKGVAVNAQVGGIKAEVAMKEAMVLIESARMELQQRITVLTGLAQGAQQVIASAQNSVSVGGNFNWSGSASISYDGT